MGLSFSFSKYSGCGNDFILIDDRCPFFPISDRGLIQRLCHRKRGIGADGVILLKESLVVLPVIPYPPNSVKAPGLQEGGGGHIGQYCPPPPSCNRGSFHAVGGAKELREGPLVADVRMVILNADGTEAEMCGNGIRCLGRYLLELGFPKKKYRIETYNRLLTLDFPDKVGLKEVVRIEMGQPSDERSEIEIEGEFGRFHYIDTGVPHLIYFTESLNDPGFEEKARVLRHHPRFQPKGTNVNAVAVSDQNDSSLYLRTFERGVEGETAACGTGAAAAAIAAHRVKGVAPPITVHFQLGEHVVIDFVKRPDETIEEVTMTGPADFVFSGFWSDKQNS